MPRGVRPLVALLATALLATGCGHVSVSVGPPDGGERTTTPGTPPSPASASQTEAVIPGAARRDLAAVVDRHRAEDVVIALVPVGGNEPELIGDDAGLVAWSTIKVPLALAAVRAEAVLPANTINQAISASDNDAAMRLWRSLGEPAQAGPAVEEVLRDAGDKRTQVQAEQTRAGYSPFGQTVWRVVDQARFVAGLPCLPAATKVTRPMGEVVDGQRWGLGLVDGSRYKGGWGPTAKGYVVRQTGLVPTGDGGQLAVAMAARTAGHPEGTAIMDELTRALAPHLDEMTGGSCG